MSESIDAFCFVSNIVIYITLLVKAGNDAWKRFLKVIEGDNQLNN